LTKGKYRRITRNIIYLNVNKLDIVIVRQLHFCCIEGWERVVQHCWLGEKGIAAAQLLD
jgi:hypothetical protein